MKSWEGLGSNWHNGIGQGGNKSFCAYRLGFGVPGYTGFVPVSENIAIPVKKASAERAPLDRGHGDHGDGGALTMSKLIMPPPLPRRAILLGCCMAKENS